MECLNSQLLLFNRDDKSRQKATELKINLDVLQAYARDYASDISTFRLSDFPIYASRLDTVLIRMREWRPRNYKQLWLKPYNDPLAWHAFWFSWWVLAFTAISITLSIVQVVKLFV